MFGPTLVACAIRGNSLGHFITKWILWFDMVMRCQHICHLRYLPSMIYNQIENMRYWDGKAFVIGDICNLCNLPSVIFAFCEICHLCDLPSAIFAICNIYHQLYLWFVIFAIWVICHLWDGNFRALYGHGNWRVRETNKKFFMSKQTAVCRIR